MYSEYLEQYVADISVRAQVDPQEVHLLQQSAACMIGAWGSLLGARTDPPADFLTLTLQLLMLDEGLAAWPAAPGLEGAHYLVGLGLEQSGEMIARLRAARAAVERAPLENDQWYRLALAYLHYLAGGHAIQAVSVLRHLERIAAVSVRGPFASEYRDAQQALDRLYKATTPSSFDTDWERAVFGAGPEVQRELRRVSRLAHRVVEGRQRPLAELGRGTEAAWLSRRGVDRAAAPFWADYLSGLERRGVTALGPEQAGSGGVDSWLRLNTNLLVVLPTGAGKTLVGELRSALALVLGKQALWMLPTRALVRQIRRELRHAFEGLGVRVQELPITEDYAPVFTDGFGSGRLVAVTTPEKILGLLRVNPAAVRNVGLVVLDEAQMLQSGARGTTAELAVHQLHALVPTSDLVLMTAWHETIEPLERLLRAVGGHDMALISSSKRPTRQMCGVVTDEIVRGRRSPIVLLYPPGIQSDSSTTDNPIAIHLQEVQLRPGDGALAIATAFASCAARSPLLTAVFAQQKPWTESNAKKIAEGVQAEVPLPQSDVARIRVELGRESIIETTAVKRVAPHHAGLTPLEQHLVEKWVRKELVRTVVATPTLAQGVNLPFDVSIVTFVRRFHATAGIQRELDRSEIMNMLGRSGRAGHISDGICLIAVPSAHSSPVRVLDSQRALFFGRPRPSTEQIGLARLIALAANSAIDRIEWLEELGGLQLADVQSLVTFVIQEGLASDGSRLSLGSRISTFPSVEGMVREELENSVVALEQLLDNVQEQCGSDSTLLAVLGRTGMPVGVLEAFLSELRSTPERLRAPPSELISWADETVLSALANFSQRRWYADLLRDADLRSMFNAISLWRRGAPLDTIESSWQFYTGARDRERSNRINIGAWLNHGLPLLSQFWGALAACARMEQGTDVAQRSGIAFLERLSAFVREGVSSIYELEWLYALGGLDRVLAHSLASLVPAPVDPRASRAQVRRRLRRWGAERHLLEDELGQPVRAAVEGVLDEIGN